MRLRVGYWGARADSRGLARQSEGFCNHIDFTRVMGLDLTVDDLSPYPCDWTPYDHHNIEVLHHSAVTEEVARRWLRGLDVVIGAETFYRDEFPLWAKEEGVRTILQINPEFAGWWYRGQRDPKPDLLIAPTIWRMAKMPGVRHVPFPVDRQEFPFQLRTHAERFVHVAGHKAMGDRAGTRMLAGALSSVRTGPEIIIRTQSHLDFTTPGLRKAVVQHANVPDPRTLYADADVVILLRRYGGQHLAANEALSCGCPVMMLDREPEKSWGGVQTVSARIRGHIRTKGGLIETYEAQRGMIARTINWLYDHPEEVEKLSGRANAYAESISWDRMLSVYQDLFIELMAGAAV